MNRIAVERKLHEDMTQEELAELIGVSRQTIIRWEGGAPIPQERLIELSTVFKCNLDWLIGLTYDRRSTAKLKTG